MSVPALAVTPLGGDRYSVAGGAEPHVVELGAGARSRCDCADFTYRGRGRDCKHLAAVLRFRIDPDVAVRVAQREGP